MSVQRIGKTLLKKNALLILLLLMMMPGWTFMVTGEVHNSPRHHNRYSDKVINHQFNHSPTAAGYLKSRTTNSASSSSSNWNSPPPTKVFYKSFATKDIRRNGSVDDVPLVRRIPPPDTNPWFTLYRPSSPSPQYAHRTKKPVEISWKPAHVVLDEVPRSPLPRFQQDTNSNPHLPPKDYYRHVYGTHEGVKHLKGNYGPTNLPEAKAHLGVAQDLEDVQLANEHFLKMRSDGRCKVPVPEVVCVKDLYPNPTKEYLPRCTLLHRCGDRSGCCDSDALSCVPRAMQEVALNFYIIQADLPVSQVGLENSIEKLLFTNHTECECVPNPTTPAMPTNEPAQNQADDIQSPEDTPGPPTLLEDDHKELKELRGNEIQHEEEEEEEEADHQKDSKDKPNHKCRECPEPFHRRHYTDRRCSCDCFDKQKPCLKIKRGNGPLADHEKRCVESNKCHIPDCEFGVYNASTGRCPKKSGKHPNGLPNGPISIRNPNHRWNYFERD